MGLRQQRLGDEVRDILASCFQGGFMNDPRLANVTITAVKLSGDLYNASVYYRVYLDEGKEEVQRGLEGATGFLRRQLAQNLDIRRVPEIKFFYDESIAHGSKIEGLLHEIRSRG